MRVVGGLRALTAPPARRRQWCRGRNVCLVAAPALLAVLGARYSPATAHSLVTASGLGLLAGTDIEDRSVPRRALRVAAAAAAITFLAEGIASRQWEPSQRAAIAALLVAGVTGPLWWFAPGSFAFGDVKVSVLAGAGAAAASWSALAATFFLACVIGSLLGLVVFVHRARSVKAGPAALTIPFVPGLTVGFILAVSMC